MTDRRRPFGLPPLQRDRDELVHKHAAVPSLIEGEEATGKHTGPELAAIRSRRPTPERISRVEARQDRLEASIGETRENVARMDGKLDTLVELASKADAERERRVAAEAAERANVRKSLPGIIKAIGYALALVIAALVGKGAL